ncbi:amine oxidase [Thamnocephalis sphaerospora]|uniref:Amine oxidase n=1 Tax=Thamnocephalis sphaerospora TaxID=78915 RepID=A0A4P9XLY1_9FUNG|nr:amine oxidase [Thamnocephalis sphaerospora]|eukprot:RKP06855.1 amine oxidase [Thamnocephalis sphaerospora]
MTTSVRRVIIIGAGAAGLAAARRLREHGIIPIVLEARDRVGGRVHSVPFPDKGCMLNLGASIVHGAEGNPLTAAIEAAPDISMIPFASNVVIPRPGAPPMSVDDSNRFIEAEAEALESLRPPANPKQGGDSIADLIHPALAQVAAKYGIEAELMRCNIDAIVSQYADDLDKVSSRQLFDVGEFEGGDYMVLGGIWGALHAFAGDAVVSSVRLNHEVTHITHSGADVRVRTRQHGELSADAVLVTVPLGVLKAGDIAFEPPLSTRRQQAIARQGFGVLDLALLEFSEVFWPAEADYLVTLRPSDVTDPAVLNDLLPRDAVPFVSYTTVMDRPLMLCFLNAGLGVQLEECTDEEVAGLFERHLKRYFPHASSTRPVRCRISRWLKDPYAHGSFSYFSVGGDGLGNISALAAPCLVAGGASSDISSPIQADQDHPSNAPALFWAGEHTHELYYATVPGAMLSGQRAADEILAHFGQLPL